MIRLTAFPVDPVSVDEKGWWKELTGTDPETETKKKLERQYDGTYEDAGLQLTVDPVRVQWARFPLVDPKDMPDEFPNIGTFPDASDYFLSMMEKWLSKSPPLKRLAFGTVLLQSVENRESGYRLLNDYLDYVQLDPNASDFTFQINRCRASDSGVDGLKINRLMKWTLFRWEIGINVSEGGKSPRHLTPSKGFACRLELDINTVPDIENDLPNDRLIPLWKELIHIAHDIAAEGDKQ